MITLLRGTLLRLPAGAGRSLTAHAGTVWITEERNQRDIVLGPGEHFRSTQAGLALVEALSDASLSLDDS